MFISSSKTTPTVLESQPSTHLSTVSGSAEDTPVSPSHPTRSGAASDSPPHPVPLTSQNALYHTTGKKKPTTPRPTSGSVDPRRCSCDASGVVWETCRRETMEVGGPGVGVLLGGPSVCRGRSEAKWTDPKSYVRSMCGRSPAIL